MMKLLREHGASEEYKWMGLTAEDVLGSMERRVRRPFSLLPPVVVCAPGDLIVGEHAPLGALVSQGILCGV